MRVNRSGCMHALGDEFEGNLFFPGKQLQQQVWRERRCI